MLKGKSLFWDSIIKTFSWILPEYEMYQRALGPLAIIRFVLRQANNMLVDTVLLFLLHVMCLYTPTTNDLVSIKSNGTTFIGVKLETVLKKKPYAAFWKIAYAEPPLYHLRFKPPQRYELWSNNNTVHNYSVPYAETCATGFNEDCLYLSLYVPVPGNPHTDFPVFVWIHENSNSHGPDFFIDEEILVIAVSYRTHIFGFLNTGDTFAQGNMGAKDVLLALRWVRDNVSLFNGNPNKVTVAGSGRAANIVASLLVSDAADDLFSRVIIQSGSALSPADFVYTHLEVAKKLYWNLNGPYYKFDRDRLYGILSTASTEDLLIASRELFDSTEVRDNQRLINSFGLSIENNMIQSFLNKFPIDVYKRRMTNNNVDVMIGYNSLEKLYKLVGLAKNKELLKYLNYNFQYLLPFEGKSDKFGSTRYKEIKRRIMEFYFINGTIGDRSLRRYAKYISDQVIYPILRQAKMHAESSCNDVYLYRFSFKGSLNMGWKSSMQNLNLSGATFGDEICYLFRCKSVNEVYSSDVASNERQFIKKIVRLWANFVKFGNPTPQLNDDVLRDTQWKPLDYNPDILRGINLSRKLLMVKLPENKRFEFWNELRSDFFPEKILHEEL